jgi:hypothetical protein
MSSEFAFDCGCKFKILNNIVSEEFPRLEFSGKLDELDLSCQRTWDMISIKFECIHPVFLNARWPPFLCILCNHKMACLT